MLLSIFAICIGACAGALLRWSANLALNPIFSAMPMGTLFVNLLGSLIMGAALSFFAGNTYSPEWKLLLITGFLGSFTTFSAFAGEMAALLQEGRLAVCALGISLHVFGSIAMVFLGMWLFALLRRLAA